MRFACLTGATGRGSSTVRAAAHGSVNTDILLRSLMLEAMFVSFLFLGAIWAM